MLLVLQSFCCRKGEDREREEEGAVHEGVLRQAEHQEEGPPLLPTHRENGPGGFPQERGQ